MSGMARSDGRALGQSGRADHRQRRCSHPDRHYDHAAKQRIRTTYGSCLARRHDRCPAGAGILFGLVSGNSEHTDDTTTDGQGPVVSAVLLVIAVVFYVTAFKQLFTAADDDAPPPKWMAKLESTTPLAAFGFGAGILAIGAKPDACGASAGTAERLAGPKQSRARHGDRGHLRHLVRDQGAAGPRGPLTGIR